MKTSAAACVSGLVFVVWGGLFEFNRDGASVPLFVRRVLPACTSTAYVCILFLKSKWGLFRAWDAEILFVIGCAWTFAVFVVLDPVRTALLFGWDFHDGRDGFLYHPGLQALPGLQLVGTTLVMCLYVPVRSCRLWIAPICGVGLHTLLIFTVDYPTYPPMLFELVVILALTLFSLHGAYSSEMNTRARWLAQRQVETQQCLLSTQEQAVYRILERFCDCLIHLGACCTILEPTPRLSAMLLHTSGSSAQGKSLCDYFASEEDRSRFSEAVRRIALEVDCTEMLPLRMMDSHGRQFQVHAYCSCFQARLGDHRFLVGLVEAQERTENLGELQASRAAPTIVGRSHAGSENSSESGWESAPDSDIGEVAISFRDDTRLTLISCTTGFTALSGPFSVGESLADRISDPEDFDAWVQLVSKLFKCIESHRDLELCSPVARSSGISYKVRNCILDAVGVHHEGGLFIRVVFEGVRQRQHKRAPSNRKALQRARSKVTGEEGKAFRKGTRSSEGARMTQL